MILGMTFYRDSWPCASVVESTTVVHASIGPQGRIMEVVVQDARPVPRPDRCMEVPSIRRGNVVTR